MCGFIGYIISKNLARFEKEIYNAVKTLRHRGPEQENIWIKDNVGFGHSRLSILDLKNSASQPMKSLDDRYVITYNGEIYNFKEIHKTLKGNINKDSDTRVLIESISQKGLKKTLKILNGMFSFALWDNKKKKIHLVRDSMGIKPMYLAKVPEGFIFGSEIKALKKFASFSKKISQNGVFEFFINQYIPAPFSIFEKCSKLRPGEIITINENLNLESQSFFPSTNRYNGIKTQQEAQETFQILLKDSLNRHYRSDVPIASFLSGGIDSSLIVGTLASNKNFKTFSVGYLNKEFDESHRAKVISDHFKLSHEKLIIKPEDIKNTLKLLPTIYDEPFADASSIPVFLMSKKISKNYKVALSGDGADELFGGYPRYFSNFSVWKKFGWIPLNLRNYISKLINDKSSFQKYFFNFFLKNPTKSLPYLKKILTCKNIFHYFISNNFLGLGTEGLVKNLGSIENSILMNSLTQTNQIDDLLLFDQKYRLADNMLTKVDRASMANSLEVRVPYLDNEIVAFSRQINKKFSLNPFFTKPILRNTLNNLLPKKFLTPVKTGFHIPIKIWLKDYYSEWAKDLIFSKKNDDIIDMRFARKSWKIYSAGETKMFFPLWNILMYLQWKKVYI